VLADPFAWDHIPCALATLQPGVDLDTDLIDYMLLLHWTKVHQEASAYWITLKIARMMAGTATRVELSYMMMRQRLLLSPDGPVDEMPVLVPIVVTDHLFLAIFDHRNRTAHVLGQNRGRSGLATNIMWNNWNGPSLWAQVAALFGWESHPEGVTLSGQDLLQVCGKYWSVIDSYCQPERTRLWPPAVLPYHEADPRSVL
jgi:hypothetical protein